MTTQNDDWRGSTQAFRTMIAREIWAYQECPWDFDNPPEGMAQLQKQIAIDEAERIRARLFGSELLKAYVRHHGNSPTGLTAWIKQKWANYWRRYREYEKAADDFMQLR